MLSVFEYPTDYTHMPHVVRWRGKELLFFCVRQPDTDIWRPAYTDWNDESDPIRNLALPTISSVCNPHCFVNEQDELTFSYMARNQNNEWQLYQTSTPDLLMFQPALQKTTATCWSGFVAQTMVVTADYDYFTVERPDEKRQYQLTNIDTIFRIFPHNDNALLITVAAQQNFFTYLLPLDSYELKRVQTSTGEEVYKSTLYGNYLVTAKMLAAAGSLEQRKLFYTDAYTLAPAANISLLDISNPWRSVKLYG